MNKIYTLIRFNRFIKSQRIKYFGIYLLHIFGKRYFAVFLDPALACNLRCKMCYFSDDNIRKAKQSRMLTGDEVAKIAGAFFHRALKLQIGCGAEPSLFPYNKEIIRLAKEKRVPYISMTTNANRFKENDWAELLEAGLDEVTLSLHGVSKATYEYFMTNASYEAFLHSLKILTDLKKDYPAFKVRLNYTVNADNLQELSLLFDTLNDFAFDILQIRPIQALGNTAYNNFSWDAIIEQYDQVIDMLRKESANHNVTFIAPSKKDLTEKENKGSSIFESTYFYISPKTCWTDDFDLNTDTYESYAHRTHLGKKLLCEVFRKTKSTNYTTRNLNYKVQ
ncbi:MAG: radical SAM protein [Dysgonamonadaceae bacterium]|jgi:MoaA/NifB/PqqE/SkfB family radical SAM enzyme|nr:radical SAM protein [Dysgonamonadaceae bacterium]